MKKPNFFKRIYKSLNDPAFYPYVVKEHFFRAFAYLFILTTILAIPFTTKMTLNFNQYIDIIQTVLKDPACPDFTLDSNKLEFHTNQAYLYEDSEMGIIVVIDPSGTYGINDLAGYTGGYLFTQSGVIYSQPGMAPQNLPYDVFWMGMSMDKATMSDMMEMSAPISVALLFGLVLFLTIAYVLFLSLFGASMTFFSKNLLALNLTFVQSYKVGIYAMTGPLLILSVLAALPFDITTDALFFIFIFLNGIFVARAVQGFIQPKNSTD